MRASRTSSQASHARPQKNDREVTLPTEADFENDFRALEEALAEDLDLLGQIKAQEDDGLLPFRDWCRIQLLIKKYADVVYWPSLRRLISQRRNLLTQN